MRLRGGKRLIYDFKNKIYDFKRLRYDFNFKHKNTHFQVYLVYTYYLIALFLTISQVEAENYKPQKGLLS